MFIIIGAMVCRWLLWPEQPHTLCPFDRIWRDTSYYFLLLLINAVARQGCSSKRGADIIILTPLLLRLCWPLGANPAHLALSTQVMIAVDATVRLDRCLPYILTPYGRLVKEAVPVQLALLLFVLMLPSLCFSDVYRIYFARPIS